MKQTIEITEISKLKLEPGDVLVVKLDTSFSLSDRAMVREYFSKLFPDNAISVIDKSIELEIVQG